MPWVAVRCPNEECPGREVHHPRTCTCGGTGRLDNGEIEAGADRYSDCEDGEVLPARWEAMYIPSTREVEGYFDSTIHCPSCGEEGEWDDD